VLPALLHQLPAVEAVEELEIAGREAMVTRKAREELQVPLLSISLAERVELAGDRQLPAQNQARAVERVEEVDTCSALVRSVLLAESVSSHCANDLAFICSQGVN